MTTRDGRDRIVSVEQLEQALSQRELERLADLARVPQGQRAEFGVRVIRAAFAFRDAASQMTVAELHSHLGLLVKALGKALKSRRNSNAEELADVFESTPEEALAPLRQREQIEIVRTQRAHTRSEQVGADALAADLNKALAALTLRIPTVADLRDPERRWRAMSDLYALATAGAVVREGRLRPGGKRSRPTVDVRVNAPPSAAHRPKDLPEAILCATLGEAYWSCTGRLPKRRSVDIHVDRHGPFIDLLKAVLLLCGSKASADDLGRRYLVELKTRLRSDEGDLDASTP